MKIEMCSTQKLSTMQDKGNVKSLPYDISQAGSCETLGDTKFSIQWRAVELYFTVVLFVLPSL